MTDPSYVGSANSVDDLIPPARRPSDEEREFYYSGVQGTLLARTSTQALPPRHLPWPPRKTFSTIGQHPILAAWSATLVQSIRAALVQIDWIRFYPIRLGFLHEDYTSTLPRDELILLVDVVPGTATWESGFAAASNCRQLLRQVGLSDVEVELREVEPRPHGGACDLRQRLDSADWNPQTPKFLGAVLKPVETLNELITTGLPDFVGFEIAPQGQPRRGTMGPIIQLADRPSELYGLTCRHVVHSLLPSKFSWLQKEEGYTAEGVQPADRHFITSPGIDMWPHAECTVRNVLKEIIPEQRRLEVLQIKNTCEPERYKFSPRDEAMLDNIRRYAEYSEDLLKFLDTAKLEPSVIGHVAFMPPACPSQSGFLRDWALIRLDEATMDQLPTNKVLLDYGRDFRFDSAYDEERDAVKLSGLLSFDKKTDRKAISVAKRGIITGFTFGTTNEIKAVVRIPAGDSELCWEWIVLPDPKRELKSKFSAKGDSGSCVFTMDGQVVGLLTGGYATADIRTPATRQAKTVHDNAPPLDPGPANYEKIRKAAASEELADYHSDPDLSFVSPMDFVFDDIRQVTGHEPRLA